MVITTHTLEPFLPPNSQNSAMSKFATEEDAFATEEDAGESSGEQNRGITGEGRFATRTESPGFENFNERIVSSDTREEVVGGRDRKRDC